MFVRTVKVPSSSGTVNEYVRIVESYRDGGRVKQRTIADLGRKDLLARLLPQLERVLRGDIANPDLDVLREEAAHVEVLEATTWGPVLVVRALFDHMRLWPIFDELLVTHNDEPVTDRAFVPLANGLIDTAIQHSLA